MLRKLFWVTTTFLGSVFILAGLTAVFGLALGLLFFWVLTVIMALGGVIMSLLAWHTDLDGQIANSRCPDGGCGVS